jgi:hypothetical protein
MSREESVLFANPAFLTILLSVFAHDIDPALTQRCLASVTSRASFIAFAGESFPAIGGALIEAIVDVVAVTYSPAYQVSLEDKPLTCPVSVWRARGDGTSFVCDGARAGLDIREHELAVGHYTVLKPQGISELLASGLA